METPGNFDRRFPNEEACRLALQAARWSDGVTCPKCGGKEKVYALKSKPFYWLCKPCGNHRFSVISDTIFENTKKPLMIWFKVAYLMLVAKKVGARTRFIARSTAIRLLPTITRLGICARDSARRCATRNGPRLWVKSRLMKPTSAGKTATATGLKRARSNARLRVRNRSGSYRLRQVRVIGAIERKGNVVCKIIGDASAETLGGFVRTAVSEKVSLVATDENQAYDYVRAGLPHEKVQHSAGEYVRGNVHTNNIESFWSLLKRGFVGTFHKVSKPYLPLCLAEFTFRHNNRGNPDMFMELLSRC